MVVTLWIWRDNAVFHVPKAFVRQGVGCLKGDEILLALKGIATLGKSKVCPVSCSYIFVKNIHDFAFTFAHLIENVLHWPCNSKLGPPSRDIMKTLSYSKGIMLSAPLP